MNNLKLNHSYNEEEGHILEFSIKGRLGGMPSLVESLLETTIKPLAQKYDPHWEPEVLPITPPAPQRSPEVQADLERMKSVQAVKAELQKISDIDSNVEPPTDEDAEALLDQPAIPSSWLADDPDDLE